MTYRIAGRAAAIALVALYPVTAARAQGVAAQNGCLAPAPKKKGLGLGGLLGAAKRAGVGDMLGGRMGGGLFGGNKGGQVAGAIAGTAMEAAVASTNGVERREPAPCAQGGEQ